MLFSKTPKFDIVSIGDCAVDAFIEVDEATVACDINHESCRISFSFADKIPYKSLTQLSAGNANNVAVGMSRLGFNAGFYGTVGGDSNAQVILNKLKSENVDTSLMSIQSDMQTNYHFVLVYHGERTILIKHQDFRYVLPKETAFAKWIYLTSVGMHGLSLHPEVLELLEKNPEIKMAFNPGTFQLRAGLTQLMGLFKHTEILFLNKEEAQHLLNKPTGDIKALATELATYGPKIVVITDGLKGSYCLDDGQFLYVGIYPHTPFEATGCGDAFATGFTAAKMRDLTTAEALRWGSRNGAGVALFVGPQEGLVYGPQMIEDLANWDFQPTSPL